MGQVQSEAVDQTQMEQSSSSSNITQPATSMESLIAEAVAYGDDENEGSDCVHPFVALQNCIKANPDAFSKEVLEDDEVKKEEEPPHEIKVIPPVWSKEPKSPKPKPKL
ncbi:hypothetical protein EZV62_018750 [Acer yangbiense]|uniref:CHCH domain-containing protein n=1 Tax=Acer yangbiense TaxID=1000413 RepID=A0A5C7HK78_9ROSI|nr:hypothetical protein EZV62_018750 [Acer yangbiense]